MIHIFIQIPSMKHNISLIWYLFDGRGGTDVTVYVFIVLILDFQCRNNFI
ncbi:hypothetical protein Hanom_Chr10g00912501 [Helianthus anomalus]